MTKVETRVGEDPVYVESRVWQDEGETYRCVAVHVETDDNIVDFTTENARAFGLQLIKAADEGDVVYKAQLLAAAR